MRSTGRNRRDWSLLIFILPFGIFLMMIAGQFAMRIIPRWTLNAGMGSNLEIGDNGGIPLLFNFQILTPFAWQDTYLTPNPDDGFVFPPFIVIEPFPTLVPTTIPTEIPSTTEVPVLPSTTPRPSATMPLPPPPPVTASSQPTSVPSVTPTHVIPSATNPPTATPVTPTVTPLTPTATPVTPTNSPTPLPTGFPSTPPPGPPVPPDNIVIGGADGNIGSIPPGSYTVVDLGSNPINVGGSPDGYDLVYYEAEFNAPPPGASGEIRLDYVILGISMFSDGHIYYEIFNWYNDIGNPSTDFNTNVSGILENDNQVILMSNLYNYPGTGILIDVDGASSAPPPGIYLYLVIISPSTGPDSIQIDSIEIWP